MKIYQSILAFDIFLLEETLHKFAPLVDAFHVDIIDTSVSNFIGMDFRILNKLSLLGYKFNVHYMAKWHDDLVAQIFEYAPLQTFFHKKYITNFAMFENLKKQYDIGLAIELYDEPILYNEPIIEDISTYLLMNVPLGHSGQKFQNSNIKLSHELKSAGKQIVSDGGINIENIDQVKHFDAIIIGSALMQTPISSFRQKINNSKGKDDENNIR